MGELRSRQQELDVAPAVDGWFWGVDPGATYIGWAVTNGEVRVTWLTKINAGLRGPERLATIHRAVLKQTRMLMVRYEPTAIYVEKPLLKSQHEHPTTNMANGVIQAGLWEASFERYEFPVPIFEVASSTWKKEGLGNGAAKKPEVLSWACELVGHESLSQDEADALGMAEACRRSVRVAAAESV